MEKIPQFHCFFCKKSYDSPGKDDVPKEQDPGKVLMLRSKYESRKEFLEQKRTEYHQGFLSAEEYLKCQEKADQALSDYLNKCFCTNAWKFPSEKMSSSKKMIDGSPVFIIHCIDCNA